MPTRSEYPHSSMHLEACDFMAVVVGAGAVAPTIPASSVVRPCDNFALSAARTSEGLYVITLKEKFPVILDVDPHIIAASGAYKQVYTVSWSEAAGTITVQCMLAAGSGVDDIETTDTLRLRILARKALG